MTDSNTDCIAVLGGTGMEGSALALRFAAAGCAVLIGSREEAKGKQKARDLCRLLPGANIDGGANREVAGQAEVIFLCVPFDSAAGLLEECRPKWKAGAVVVDSTVPLQVEAGRLVLRQLPEGSGSEHLASRLPVEVSFIAAFKTIPAHLLSELEQSLDCDVVVCGGNDAAKARVMEVAKTIPGLRPLDGGPLRHARALEAMCALAIGLNRRYKVKTARFRIVGV